MVAAVEASTTGSAGGGDKGQKGELTRKELKVQKQLRKEKKQEKNKDRNKTKTLEKKRLKKELLDKGPTAVDLAPVADDASEDGDEQPTAQDDVLPSGGPKALGEEQSEEKRSRSTISLVPEETSNYLTEVSQHYKTLVDDEERQLLVGNVLEEIAGKEQMVAADPVCSRHVELLLGGASTGQAIAFLQAIMDTGGMAQLSSGPFGSHVAEKLLLRVDKEADGMEQADYEAFEKLASALATEMCSTLWEFMTDRFATHVARRALCVLCGQDVVPGGSRGPSATKKDPTADPTDMRGTSHAGKGKGSGVGSLASKTSVAGGKFSGKGGAPATSVASAAGVDFSRVCRFPQHVEAVVHVLCREDFVGLPMQELATHQYASPFLQAVLYAAATLPNSRKVLCTLVPATLGATMFLEKPVAGKTLEGVSEATLTEMSEHPQGSRVFEAAVVAAAQVPGLLDELITRFFQGRGKSLSMHATANYVVQAMLAASTTAAQVTPLYKELEPILSDLLRCRRAGVVAALVAAAARSACCQRELCAALAAALGAAPPWSGKPAEQVVTAALFSLDCIGPAVLGEGSPLPDIAVLCSPKGKFTMPRLSTLGGATVINILKLQQGACRTFTDSLAVLPPTDLARVGRDPAGSRALEALLQGSAPQKVKQKVLERLAGQWAVVASSGSGAFLLEACYLQASLDIKESIVGDLAKAERPVGTLHWGPKLLARVGVELYKRDPVAWRRRAETSATAMSEFARLFGDEPVVARGLKEAGPTQQSAAQPAPSGTEAAAEDETPAQDALLQEAATQVAEGTAKGGKAARKEKRKREAALAAAAQDAPPGPGEEAVDGPDTKAWQGAVQVAGEEDGGSKKAKYSKSKARVDKDASEGGQQQPPESSATDQQMTALGFPAGGTEGEGSMKVKKSKKGGEKRTAAGSNEIDALFEGAGKSKKKPKQ